MLIDSGWNPRAWDFFKRSEFLLESVVIAQKVSNLRRIPSYVIRSHDSQSDGWKAMDHRQESAIVIWLSFAFERHPNVDLAINGDFDIEPPTVNRRAGGQFLEGWLQFGNPPFPCPACFPPALEKGPNAILVAIFEFVEGACHE